MADTYQLQEVTDAAAWDAFVGQATGGTVFSTSAWLACAQEAMLGRARFFACLRNGHLTAGISGVERRRTGLTRLVTPELTPHGGALLAPVPAKGPAKVEAEWHHAASLLAGELTLRYGYVQLAHAPAALDMRPFAWRGWSVRVRYTYRIRTGDLEATWERLERRTRTVIRKAEKAGFRVAPTEDLEAFGRLYDLVYARQGGPPPVPAAVVQRFAAAVLRSGLGRALAVTSPEGRTAAVVVFVDGGDTTYAWTAGADPDLADTGATSLLYWEYLRQAGGREFDFVGANIPGVAFFKRGFGGDLVPYYVVEGFGSRPLRALFAVQRGLQALRTQRSAAEP
ncbi:MAG: GNAT family N-acetyltransferase [Candidatus Latescibacterota bacterium]